MKFRAKGRDIFWLVIVLLPLSIYLAYSSLYGVYSTYMLSKIGVSAEAIVTDWRDNSKEVGRYSLGEGRYSLKYRFKLLGSPIWYSFTDMPGRKEVWAPIPYKDWQNSRGSGIIEVVYVPTNPWLNRPLHSSISYADLATGVIFSLLVWCFFLLGFFKSIRYWNAYLPKG